MWWTGSLVIVVLTSLCACVPNRADSCRENSDCASELCTTEGFCESECSTNEDCPCGSYCAPCGLCVRIDNRGTATCWARENGISEEEALGACRGAVFDASFDAPVADADDASDAAVGDAATSDTAVDAGEPAVCRTPPDPLPRCIVDGGVEAGADASEGVDAGVDSGVIDAGPGDTSVDSGAADTGDIDTGAST